MLSDHEIRNAKELEVFTDGACQPNPGAGGWGAVILNPRNGQTIELSGAAPEPRTTNNKMELLAAVEALEWLHRRTGPQFLCVVTDSKYVYNGITGWIWQWKENRWLTSNGDPVRNIELWQRLDKARTRHKIVRFQWIKAHNGALYNERADALAVGAIRQEKHRLET